MEKENVYVVYQCGYCEGSNFMEILGVYKNIGEAKKCYLDYIEESIKEYDFDYDQECKYASLSDIHTVTRLFRGGYQENWDNYIEFHISKEEVK